jgi:hypothetical protein
MSNQSSNFSPFLTQYEVVVPQQSSDGKAEYDESRMILIVDGVPAVETPLLGFPSTTKRTRVDNETSDDD